MATLKSSLGQCMLSLYRAPASFEKSDLSHIDEQQLEESDLFKIDVTGQTADKIAKTVALHFNLEGFSAADEAFFKAALLDPRYATNSFVFTRRGNRDEKYGVLISNPNILRSQNLSFSLTSADLKGAKSRNRVLAVRRADFLEFERINSQDFSQEKDVQDPDFGPPFCKEALVHYFGNTTSFLSAAVIGFKQLEMKFEEGTPAPASKEGIF